MPEQYRKNLPLINMNEKQFAKRVIYQLRALNPPPLWHNLVPFKFLFEYMKIRRAIRAFEKDAMVVRRIALETAESILKGDKPENAHAAANDRVKDWLKENRLYSVGIHEKQLSVARQFETHFSRLLQSEGNTYAALVRSVYRIPPHYREFLDNISALEIETDSMVCAMTADDANDRRACEARMENKHRAFSKAREMELQEVFV